MSDAPLSTAFVRRDPSRDGILNRIETYITSNFREAWEFVNRTQFLARPINNFLVNLAVRKGPARPLPWSTWYPDPEPSSEPSRCEPSASEYPPGEYRHNISAPYPSLSYTSWPSLTDRSFFSRYRPPQDPIDLPKVEDAKDLFRAGSALKLSARSTFLFPSFAQWVTDGFLMTDMHDRRRTTSSHQIDLNAVYGLNPRATKALRGERGRLKTETKNGEEWAPLLYEQNGVKKREFGDLPEPLLPAGAELEERKKATIFAFGGDRANSTTFTAMLNTLFIREHNRLARLLEESYGWDDERVFQTARMINIVQFIRIVVAEYINHISKSRFKILPDPKPCYRAEWNRPNWIPLEFNLVYRWHSLVPETAYWGGDFVAMTKFHLDNTLLLNHGLGKALDNTSRTRAWKLGLFNTTESLLPVEALGIRQGRANKIASYNDYREVFKFPRVTRFEQISSDPQVVEGLRRVYKDVDKIEFFVGIFAEDLHPRAAVTPIIGRMVAIEAFSHALTNPLLAPNVFKPETFSEVGWQSILATTRLKDIFERNSKEPPGTYIVSMELAEAERAGAKFENPSTIDRSAL
jgi:prostaglandin-endoperoxide synthase 2